MFGFFNWLKRKPDIAKPFQVNSGDAETLREQINEWIVTLYWEANVPTDVIAKGLHVKSEYVERLVNS